MKRVRVLSAVLEIKTNKHVQLFFYFKPKDKLKHQTYFTHQFQRQTGNYVEFRSVRLRPHVQQNVFGLKVKHNRVHKVVVIVFETAVTQTCVCERTVYAPLDIGQIATIFASQMFCRWMRISVQQTEKLGTIFVMHGFGSVPKHGTKEVVIRFLHCLV